MALTKITELAALIHESTTKVDDYLQNKGLPSPSFAEDGPVDFRIECEDIREARETALEASLELHHLLLGPALLSLVFTHSRMGQYLVPVPDAGNVNLGRLIHPLYLHPCRDHPFVSSFTSALPLLCPSTQYLAKSPTFVSLSPIKNEALTYQLLQLLPAPAPAPQRPSPRNPASAAAARLPRAGNACWPVAL